MLGFGLWAFGCSPISAFQPFLGCWLLNVRLFPNFSFSAFFRMLAVECSAVPQFQLFSFSVFQLF
jgi:hypothetical protein